MRKINSAAQITATAPAGSAGTIDVTVTDKNGRYVTGLQQSDVRVLEDGVPQTLFTFQRETDRPLAMSVL